jgi:hypothetical protein
MPRRFRPARHPSCHPPRAVRTQQLAAVHPTPNATTLLRRLHETPPPRGLGAPADDASIIERYLGAGGPRPPIPLTIPPATEAAFCHGDWTDGNLLASGQVRVRVAVSRVNPTDWEALAGSGAKPAFDEVVRLQDWGR